LSPGGKILPISSRACQVNVETYKNVGRNAFALFDQAEQDMLGANVFMVTALRLLIGELQYLPSAVAQVLAHGPSPQG
jgi:hypothetical protein